MRKLWYRSLSLFLTLLYYRRVRLLNAGNLPAVGPVLYVGLHRNGAVDGYVYKSQLPHIEFMISVQLRRSLIGRIFFDGIEISRGKDRAAGISAGAGDGNAVIDVCADYVRQGGELLILPEGTSDLGHRHLPFHKGAARTLVRLLDNSDTPPLVVPLGIHYEQAWAWQSDVEVVAGAPVDTRLPPEIQGMERVRVLHERLVQALERLAVQADDAETFARRERIAYAATLGSKRSYFDAMKALESGMPEAEQHASKLEQELLDSGRRLWRHQGVPLMPMHHAWAYPLLFAILAPLVVLACALNAPVLLAAAWAGRRFSDGRNTIALWRLLVGFPSLLIWVALTFLAALLFQALGWWFACLAVSLLGLMSVRRVQKLAVSLHNWAVAPSLRKPLLDWRAALEECMRARNV